MLKKRLENVRGVGSVTLVGGTRREINIYLEPAAMEALGITADQVVAAVRSENQDLPVGAIRSQAQERVADRRAHAAARGLRQDHRARKNGAGAWQVARVSDGGQEVESSRSTTASARCCCRCRSAGREHHRHDGLQAALQEMKAQLPGGVRLEPGTDASRPIRVSVDNVRRTLIEGALLTVLIVFLFLNSWRSTVITGLTLPIALIGTFLFMYASASPSTW